MTKIKISELLFPPKCIFCGELIHHDIWKFPFCEICFAKWEIDKMRCRRENYGQPVRVVEPVEPGLSPIEVIYSFAYIPGSRNTAGNALILCLKDVAERRAVDFAGAEFAGMLRSTAPIVVQGGEKHGNAVIAWIPRSHSAVRKYGFDHMQRVAKVLSHEIDVAAIPLIKRRFFTMEQKRLSRVERRQNARSTISLSKKYSVEGKTVMLIDDIVTSGASFAAAAKLLADAGAEQVIGAALAATEHQYDDINRDVKNNFNIIKKLKKRMHRF